MQSAVDYFSQTICGISAGKANPNLLNGIKVEYYGSLTPIDHLAVISAANPRLLVIQAFDDQMLSAIEKAIRQSTLSLNPQRVKHILHLPVPPLSGDRQKEVAKHINQLAEQQRVAIRNIRREVRGQISDKELDTLTKTYTGQVDDLAKAKILGLGG